MASVFTKIIAREIPADIVYEQDDIIVIKDINPEAKTHLLVIPKKEIPSMNDITPDDTELVSQLFVVAKKVATDLGIQDGYQLRLNVGPKAQDIMHVHMHLLSDL
ncbi:HIT domain-containing protein [Candidatus Gracilibacteria bacterium]|nr:HIT domain-containing protein [Candidatus Gracilibacteria bacterium]